MNDVSRSAEIKLTIPSRIEMIDLVHEIAERIAGMAGLDDGDALNTAIAVREATVNAVVHGNGEQEELAVEIKLGYDASTLTARVRDHGAGFEPEDTPDPTTSNHILDDSGRGLLMIRAYVDDVQFRFREGSGTEVTLIKKLGGTRE